MTHSNLEVAIPWDCLVLSGPWGQSPSPGAAIKGFNRVELEMHRSGLQTSFRTGSICEACDDLPQPLQSGDAYSAEEKHRGCGVDFSN